MRRTLADAEQRAHAELLQLVLAEQLDVDPDLGELARLQGKAFGVDDVEVALFAADGTIETGLSKDGILTEEMHANLHRVILALAAEIKNSAVPFAPTKDLKKECPGCPYQTMCGTQWAREGRW